MEKIAIIGSPGAGKTTLAKTLHQELHIKVYHLDRLLWLPDWQRIDGPTRVDTIQDIARERQWIIEGTYLRSSEPRLNAADTIIFLDTHPLKCLWRVIKRHNQESGYFRRDIPEGCVDRLSWFRLLKVLVFPVQERKKLKQNLRNYESEKIIRLRSQKDLERFLEHLELNKMKVSDTEKVACL
jgi:adenylate kinase family enzyme